MTEKYQPRKKSEASVYTAARTLIKGAVEFLPNALVLRKHREARQRSEYKFALLQPYMGIIPDYVVQAILDFDLLPKRDEEGNYLEDENGKEISEYSLRIRSGEVQRVISEGEKSLSSFYPKKSVTAK